MPPKPLVNLAEYDLEIVKIPLVQIRETNPQRFEMEHLSGIFYADSDTGVAIGFKEVSNDEFWIRGHLPGRPLMPGVIIIEAAAQLSTYLFKVCYPEMTDSFLGFAGIEGVKFRGSVEPGDRLILVAKAQELRSRHATFNTQGFVGERMVYEGKIIGIPI